MTTDTKPKLELFPFQREGVDYIKKNRRVILADEMGLGKTVECIVAINESDNYPAMIVVGLNTGLSVWEEIIKQWVPDVQCIVYAGTPIQRSIAQEVIRRLERRKEPYFLVTNTYMFDEVMKLRDRWPAAVFDEYHLQGLLNRKTKTFAKVRKMHSRMLIFSSGTPFTKTPADVWPVLHLLRPVRFSSYWKYVDEYCITTNNVWGGRDIHRTPSNPEEFRQMLSAFLIRRTKKQVLKDLPDKRRQIVRVEMTDSQRSMYNTLSKELILELGDNIIVTPNIITKMLRLRQLLVSPLILGDSSPGGSFVALMEMIRDELSHGNSIVVFTPFREAAHQLENYLRHEAPTFLMMGGMNKDHVDELFEGWRRQSQPSILISTIKASVGWTATEASTAFFVGCEWSHVDNLQAEDRLHRVGQKNAVRIYYLINRDSIDERVIEVVMDKDAAARLMLKRSDF